ncbi:B915 protein, partial [Atractosteus spatula]|nr:B915 protein [Atractosteus spatula]
MKEEIAATVFFITRLAKKRGKLEKRRSEKLALELTAILFETYKNHWYPECAARGQAFRCLRMNKAQLRDPLLERACQQSDVDYEELGLPREMTVWVDPGEVSCSPTWMMLQSSPHTPALSGEVSRVMKPVQRWELLGGYDWERPGGNLARTLGYGEKNEPISVAVLKGQGENQQLSQRINSAVERATSDYYSGTSSDEEGTSSTSVSQPKTIPTVSNPNSIYQAGDFGPPPAQPWAPYPKRKAYQGDGYYPPHKAHKSYRPSSGFSGPRVDRYHWVSKNRS